MKLMTQMKSTQEGEVPFNLYMNKACMTKHILFKMFTTKKKLVN